MSDETILDKLIKDGTLSQILQQSETPKAEVQAFKQVLYALGFDAVVNPKQKKIDGIYDDATVATVQSFCKKNGIDSDGKKVTTLIAKMMIKRHNGLSDMLQLHQDLQDESISKKYFEGSTDKQAISALQYLLQEANINPESKSELNVDGAYGEATVKAVNAFMEREKIPTKEAPSPTAPPVPVTDHQSLAHKCGNVLTHLLKKGGLSSVLKKGSLPSLAIKEVKQLFHKLGFGKELGQKLEHLESTYGPDLEKAVKAFSSKNGIVSEGKKITGEIAGALQKHLDVLPFMHQLQQDLREGKVEGKYFKGSKEKIAISALQAVLNELGLGKELHWATKGNDGIFDDSVVKALKTHFKKNFLQKVNKATPHMVHSLLQEVGKKFGTDWTDHVKQLSGNDDSVLTTYTNTNFQGKPIITNIAFVSMLDKINEYAKKNAVQVKITDSYRRDTDVPGAIVTPAQMSNHKVGHAIDMNLIYEGGYANSDYMNPANRSNWAAPVRGFLEDISNDPALRWGGDFHSQVDPVHIDDDLNHSDPDEWNKQRKLTVAAYDVGDIKQWKAK